MKNENINILDKIKTKDKFVDLLQTEKNIIEDNLNSKLTECQFKLEEKVRFCKELQDKTEKLEKDFKELVIKF